MVIRTAPEVASTVNFPLKLAVVVAVRPNPFPVGAAEGVMVAFPPAVSMVAAA